MSEPAEHGRVEMADGVMVQGESAVVWCRRGQIVRFHFESLRCDSTATLIVPTRRNDPTCEE